MQELSNPVAHLMCVVNYKDGVIIAGTDTQRAVPAGFECSCPSLGHQSFPSAGTYAKFFHVPNSMRTVFARPKHGILVKVGMVVLRCSTNDVAV